MREKRIAAVGLILLFLALLLKGRKVAPLEEKVESELFWEGRRI